MSMGQNISQAKAVKVRVKHVVSTHTKNMTKSCKTCKKMELRNARQAKNHVENNSV